MANKTHVFDTSGTAAPGVVVGQFYAVINAESFPIGQPVAAPVVGGSWGLTLDTWNDASSGFVTSYWNFVVPQKDAADLQWNVIVPKGAGYSVRSLAASAYSPNVGGNYAPLVGGVVPASYLPVSFAPITREADVVTLFAPAMPIVRATDAVGFFAIDPNNGILYGPLGGTPVIGDAWNAGGGTCPVSVFGQLHAQQRGFGGYNVEPDYAGTGLTPATGRMYTVLFQAAKTGSFANVDFSILTAGTGMSDCFVSVWDTGQGTAGSCTLLGTTGNLGTDWQSTGWGGSVGTIVSLASAVSVVAGEWYLGAIQGVGSPMPAIAGSSGAHGPLNDNAVSPFFPSGLYSGAGLTGAPGTAGGATSPFLFSALSSPATPLPIFIGLRP